MRTTTIALTFLLMAAPACRAQDPPPRQDSGAPIVFVCEHGSVKSLIAAARAALQHQIDALLDELQEAEKAP